MIHGIFIVGGVENDSLESQVPGIVGEAIGNKIQQDFPSALGKVFGETTGILGDVFG